LYPFIKHKKKITILIIVLGFFIWFLCCLPSQLFNDPYSIVLNDRNGNLLSAKIADDGQWRFPETTDMSDKFTTCITTFEDEYFNYHPGINPVSIYRAIKQNKNAGKIVSGGSTITMQLSRLIRKNKKRTYYEKFIETIWALRLEFTNTKKTILSLYASHAPFGTNVVGVSAASWRYFGRKLNDLSWAECATLAVLPNSPSIIYPGKNQTQLRLKRNKLLYKLFSSNKIDLETYALSIQEPLPIKPYPLPNKSNHLLNRVVNENKTQFHFSTTINYEIQNHTTEIIEKYAHVFKQNQIHNLCALVLDVEKNEVVAYIGNTPLRDKDTHGEDVDIIKSNRSTGSLLKPYLYGFMINDGQLLPNMLVPDIPTQISGYVPQNFDFTYDGAVPAKQALSRSLNIPAVKMLQQYTIEKFLDRLKQIGISSINRSADNYGLSLILGGAEAKLWDMCSAYSSMARVLNNYNRFKKYYYKDWFKPSFLINSNDDAHLEKKAQSSPIISASSIWLMFEAMAEVNRPDVDASWQRLGNSQKIAWKTGTSFGFRDAWAIGVTQKYVVGVWVGNADGEGRPGLTGISSAAPVLFEIFGSLSKSYWFKKPISDMKQVLTCKQSGCLPSVNCNETKLEWIPKNSNPSLVCSYHKLIHLDATERYRVTDVCVSPMEMKSASFFVLPPVQEYYFKIKNPSYKSLPPFKIGCSAETEKNMEMIYPKASTIIYVPYELSGKIGKTVFEIAHRVSGTTVYWHVDGEFLGSTKDIHQFALSPTKGKHMLTVTDINGETINTPFEIVSEKK
jgi:penicillin-binding protein 1C